MLDHALAYAESGWPVFPCSPNDKRPLTPPADKDERGEPVPGGLYHATCDKAQIRRWWDRWPDAMIGVPTGTRVDAFVVDIDPKDGASAAEVLERVAREAGCELPPTITAETPRGGLHLWFALPMTGAEAIRNRAGVIRGVDVRGTGGYVIVPPSVRSGLKAEAEGCEGVAYRWAEGGEDVPVPAPPALIAFVTARPDPPPPPPRPTGSIAPGGVDAAREEAIRAYAAAALAAETARAAEAAAGTRNDTLNRAALALGHLVGAGALDEAEAVGALEEVARSWPDFRKSAGTIRSGMRAGKREPADLSQVGLLAGRKRSERAPLPAHIPSDLPPGEPARPEAPMRGKHADARSARTPSHGGGAGKPPGGIGGADAGDEPDAGAIEACGREPQNDTGNARRLIAHFGADMLRVRDVGPHWWAGTHWEGAGGAEAFQRFAQRTAERIALEADCLHHSKADKILADAAKKLEGREYEDLDEGERKLLKDGQEAAARLAKRKADRRKFAISCGNTQRINGMIAQAAPHITVAPDAIDADAMSINLQNGTLRVVRETVRERVGGDDPEDPPFEVDRAVWKVRLDAHAREDRIAKVMPVEYDPVAKAPKWRTFVERFQPGEAIRRFLQRYHGYALTGMTGEQIFVFNYGLGANGKSTFMEALRRLQGGYAKVLSAESLTGDQHRRGDQATPEFARLTGARMLVCAELPRGQGFRESTLKMLTGGEAMLVRHLHESFFEFSPAFKAVGSGNDRPAIGGVDEGIWRRMKLVPWEVTIPANQRRPMEKVLAEFASEGPGILNWLIEGLLDYLHNGLQVPREIDAATESYRADMDPVGEFALACIEPMSGAFVTARDMHRAYTAWCHANSVKPYTEKGFAGIMVQKGFKREIGRIRKYLDVRLKDVPADPDERRDYPAGYGDYG